MDLSGIDNLLRASGRVHTLHTYPDMEMIVLLASAAMMMVVAAMLVSVRPHLIPPGPRLLPLIGNLHLLLWNVDLRGLVQKYQQIFGNIFSLYFGRRLVVVISGKSLLKEVFVKNSDKYSYRPREVGNTKLKADRGILYNHGPVSQQQRQFVSSVFRDLESGSKMESCIAPEMIHLTCTLMELHQQAFDPSLHLMTATSNVILSALLGTRFESDNPELLHFHENLQSVMLPPTFDSLVKSRSLTNWIPGTTYKKNKRLAIRETEIERFICHHIKNRLDTVEDDENNERGPSCLVDAYIKKIRQGVLQNDSVTSCCYNVDNLIQITLELIHLGTESTAITLEWMLLYLALNPQCQERARNEIDLVLDGAFPSYSDLERLPYMEAVILETQRVADIAPLSMLHLSTRDTVIEGLQIPANTIMVPNMTSVFHDPKLFPRPEKFKPERYLDDRGAYLKKTIMSPFFIGKRSCLCENLARMELFLLTTAMLQHFWFTPSEDASPPSFQGICSNGRLRPKPFKLVAIHR